jgi:transmembrane sensor
LNLDRKHWIRIQRYITGNASPDENRAIKEWMALDSENRKLVHELKQIWNLTPDENFEVNVQQAWEQFRNRDRDLMPGPSRKIGYVPRKVSRKPLHILRAAAVILVAFFTGLFVQYHIDTMEQIAAEQTAAFNVLQELETEKGEKARVTFSDGTRVTLNSASSVKFPQEFRGGTREVYLEGEAFFEVSNNPNQPFIVHSQDAKVEVLGTEFNVRGWGDDPGVEVVVKGGKVSVQSLSSVSDDPSEAEVIVTGGYSTRLERGQNPIAPQRVDVVHHLLWTSGGMHFDNDPFNQVVKELERRFNVNITVADQTLMDVPYTGTFQYAELDEVLTVIAASMEVGFSREGSEVVFINDADL